MLEFGLEVYGGHGRVCVCVWAWFFRGLEEALSLSLSEMVGFRDVGCVYSRELEEGVECTCLCCQVHGEETRSLSVYRGCSLM